MIGAMSINTIHAQSKESYTCGAITKSGNPCKNRVKEAGAKCWMHGGVSDAKDKGIAVQCSATTKKGERCKNRTTNSNGLCHMHNK